MLLAPGRDRCDGHADLAGDERRAAAGRLVVEQDPVHREHPVGLAVVAGHPVGVDLGRAVGAAGPEGGVLVLRRRGGPEHLRGTGLVVAALQADHPDRFEQAGAAHPRGHPGELGLVEGDSDVALSGEVVDLGRLHPLEQGHQPGAVGEVAVVQEQPGLRIVRVPVQVLDPRRVEGRGAPDHSVHLVALGEQQLSQVGTVLAGDPRDERYGSGHSPRLRVVRAVRRSPGHTEHARIG